MLFVPLLLFGTVSLTCVVIAMLAARDHANRTSLIFVLLVAIYAVQSLLLSLRWGYGFEDVGLGIAALAPVLPVCAYVAYLTLTERPKVGWLWLSVIVVANWVVLTAFQDLADISIFVTYIGLGTALMLRARKGSDAMVLARMGRVEHTIRAMFLTGVALVASGLVDLFLLIDFIKTGGQNVGLSVTLAQSGFLLCVGAAALVGRMEVADETDTSTDRQDSLPDAADADVHRRLTDLFVKDTLHRDTELNLRRLSRKLGLPDRTVSRAINRIKNQSVSQFVNTFRINDACKMLSQTDQSVLQVSLAARFLTKSNFNREFLRVTGLIPSQ
jgi:AraC-like DNA-binding protein